MNPTQAKQEPMTKNQQRKLDKAAGLELIKTVLPKYYPQCFNINAIKPLKIGIYDDIRAEHPELNEKVLKAAIQIYCGRMDYLRSCVSSQYRIDLQGNEVEAITEKNIKHSQQRLQQHENKVKKEKDRKRAYKQVEAEAKRKKIEKLKQKKGN